MPQDMNAMVCSQIPPQFRSTALVAVGSNTPSGDESLASTISRAIRRVGNAHGAIRAVSRYYATPAFPPGSGADFVNAAFAWSADLGPQAMLALLHEVEHDLGRVRGARWGARVIDLDLIAVGGAMLPDAATLRGWIDLPLAAQQTTAPPELVLPHPRLQDRAFVLVPLCDIAPHWRHPLLGQTAAELRGALPAADLASVIALENQPEQP